MNGDGESSFPVKLPPHNLEAERALLGSCLMRNDVIDEVAGVVGPGDFYRDAHERAWQAIQAVRESGEPVDAVTVGEYLDRQRARGVDDLLAEIERSTPSAANALYYARIVRGKATQRRLIEAANEILAEAYSANTVPAGMIAHAEERIFAVAEREVTGSNVEAGPLMTEAMLTIGRREAGERAGLVTGFGDLDALLDGLKPQDLVILAARPSQGKTALATAIVARACLGHEASVLFASLEMNAASIGDRLISAHSGIDSERLRRAWLLTGDERGRLAVAAEELAAMRLTIDDKPSQAVAHVAANARRIKSRRGLDLVVIDYLSLLDGQRRKGENRQEEVARISRRLKAMARELDVPVLCLHQLNRQSETREDRRPRLADLRESGQIEQDADAVLLLHRPEYYDPNDRPGVAEVIVAKNRNGPTGTVRLVFRRHCTRFEGMAEPISGGVF